jgi:hypothetical protein
VILINKTTEPHLLALLNEYATKPVVQIGQEEIKTGESMPRDLTGLTSWFESVLGKRVKAVRVSSSNSSMSRNGGGGGGILLVDSYLCSFTIFRTS